MYLLRIFKLEEWNICLVFNFEGDDNDTIKERHFGLTDTTTNRVTAKLEQLKYANKSPH
jgi:hypothetical protein